MRFLGIAILALILASPALAQTNNGASGHKFGSTNCPGQVPCPDSSATLSSSDLAALGNSCVKQYFALTGGENGYFDDIQGLGSDDCLTAKSMGAKSSNGVYPHCCVIKLESSACVMHCDITN